VRRVLRGSLVVLAVLPFVLLRNDAVRGALVALLEYLRTAGVKGVLLFLAMEMVAGVTLVPIWLMAAMAGYTYGFPEGVLLAVPGVTLAGCSGFLAGRQVFSRGFKPAFIQGPYWQAVQRATAHEGLKIALLFRVTPVVPQNLSHYLMASTSMSLRHFAMGVFFGLMPVTALQVYMGSLVKSAAALVAGEGGVGGGPLRWVLPVVAVVVTVVGGVMIARVGRRMLRETLAAADPVGGAVSVDPGEGSGARMSKGPGGA